MSKPSMNLDSLLTDKTSAPMGQGTVRSRRLSLEVDPQTYRRLRQLSLDHDLTHQAILEKALLAFLDSRG